ncbi:hypothetical protein CABS01_01690 [Colletotrichum abscissum]|uniref:uncharacterized protein n=1 Tax=Colletotrichum abscissum TaxID=1671311 RepID=UPI0027D64364|nr:uncharacterized protein CABS01_01690 [Colletotrichum abscissum]KAK1495883.1 hypothetical protein CABS01_01690 [Colletotrichum abscissum]
MVGQHLIIQATYHGNNCKILSISHRNSAPPASFVAETAAPPITLTTRVSRTICSAPNGLSPLPTAPPHRLCASQRPAATSTRGPETFYAPVSFKKMVVARLGIQPSEEVL